MSFAIEVVADSSGIWAGNAIRFQTREEAALYGADLARRWRSVRKWRVVESTDPVGYVINEHGAVSPIDKPQVMLRIIPETMEHPARRELEERS